LNDDLTRRLLDTVDSMDGKLDDLRDRTTRVEEQLKASRDAQEIRHGDNKLSLSRLAQEIAEHRNDTDTGFKETGDRHSRLELRVVRVEDATRLLKREIKGAAIKVGGAAGAGGTGVGLVLWPVLERIGKKLGLWP
jgi:hypothetical protein